MKETIRQAERVIQCGQLLMQQSHSKRSVNVLMKLDIQHILSDVQFTNNGVLRVDTRVELLKNYTEILKKAHQIQKALQENLT